MQQTFFETDETQPLAARLRPTTLDEFAGQKHLLGEGKVLRRLIENDRISSMIFWGPPGVGKTTLARIIAGLGVIENDFHERKDLTPNVCAVYTEEDCRGRGVAGALLRHVCADMKKHGIDTLYLVTDHTSFYERYGWNFLCMVQQSDASGMVRMYVHREGVSEGQ